MNIFDNAVGILLVGAVILILSIIAGKAGYRFGLPSLLLFLGVGMLFGSDGLNVIRFQDPDLAQFVGMLALTVILFSGGMDTSIKEIRPVAGAGVMLATVGVLLTIFITGTFVYLIFGLFDEFVTLSYAEALLLASVMSSTDSASVFSILRSRSVYLKERLRPALELESGSNDPMAYMMTIVLIAYIGGSGSGIGSSALMLAVQLCVGALMGFATGKAGVWAINRINLENASLYSILVLAIAFLSFAATTALMGNGYLAVYIAGLVMGNARLVHQKSIRTFMDGFTWLWQIVMFIVLGLLVNPHELPPVALPSIIVAVFMMLVARPASVLLCLAPFRKFSTNARLYISWVGLRGAVPIIFATYPMIAGVEHAQMFFNIVFFITILSLLVQGTTVTAAARWLGLQDGDVRKDEFDIELPQEIKSAMSEVVLTDEVLAHGNKLMELALPDHTLAVMVKREDRYFIPKGNTELRCGDRLLLISDNDKDLLRAYDSLSIRSYTLKKN